MLHNIDAEADSTSIREMNDEAVQRSTARSQTRQFFDNIEEPGLKFINVTDEPASRKGEYADAVRSHARRVCVYRKRDLSLKHKGMRILGPAQIPRSYSTIEDSSKLQGKFRLINWRTTPRSEAVLAQAEKTESPATIVRLLQNED